MKKKLKLTLISEGLHSTGVELEYNKWHGDWAVFYQSYPHPLLGHTTEQVMIKVNDFDKVINFLQQAKEQLKG